MSEECNENTNILICYSIFLRCGYVGYLDSGQKDYQDVLLWRDGGPNRFFKKIVYINIHNSWGSPVL